MEILGIRDRVIAGYRDFTTSLVEPRNERIREHVRARMAEGRQWPDPWVSLNPFFASGGTITQAVDDGVLHPGCRQICRIKESREDARAREITMHRHEREAVEIARSGRSYVLTTGTGSGKSLAHIIPIVDRVLREGERNPNVREGDRRLSDECPGELTAGRAGEVPETASREARSR